ncbi:MAG: PAS domain S-box protein [Deltaproteobacteria bacterium]|nr:PAS domain S-box protein [Candidatus Desulfobacula maris]
MKFLKLGSISQKLTLLILFAVMPCLAILLYSGLEQRQHLIEMARSDVLLLTRSMAEAQKGITRSTKQILGTLSQLPAIQAMDPDAGTAILKTVLEQNPNYNNMALVDLSGEVLASGKPFTGTNLADRRHIMAALEKKDFAAGEYIITRVGTANPSFAFAYPVSDKDGIPRAVLTAAIKLDVYAGFYDVSTLPEKSFIAVTDYKGIRIFYYPAQKDTNPIGKPIGAKAWNTATKGEEHGLFFGTGSDGLRRIFAYEKVYLDHEDTPYLYVWAGIPEDHILKPANAALIRNLLLMLLATVISIFISWGIGKKSLISPIQSLVMLTRKFAQGNLEARSEITARAGEVGVLTGAFHDMADALKQSRQTIQKSEEQLKTIIVANKDAMIVINNKGLITLFNPAAEEIFHHPAQTILGQSLNCLMPVSYRSQHTKDIASFFATGLPNRVIGQTIEVPAVRADGEEFPIEISLSRGGAGEQTFVVGVIRDITERKRAEEALKKSEETFSGFFNQGNIGMAITSLEKGWIKMNKKLCDMLGYTRDELSEKTWTEMTWPDDLEPDLVLFKKMQSGEIENYEMEKRFVRKNQDIIHTHLTVSCLRHDDGGIDKVLATLQDITDRKTAEDQLKIAQIKLIESEKLSSIGTLSAGIAHELNNPLMGILNYNQYALKKLPPEDKLHRVIKDAERATKHCIKIVQNLLTFSHFDKADQEVCQDVDFKEMVERVLGLLAYRIEKGNIIVLHDTSDVLSTIHVRVTKMQQVLLNLIANAIDAVEESEKKEIRITLFPDDDNAVIVIEDTGHGISSENITRIFDPFFTTKPVGKGTGLGLSVSYGIVKDHDGEISCNSKMNQSTRFAITLPNNRTCRQETGEKNG